MWNSISTSCFHICCFRACQIFGFLASFHLQVSCYWPYHARIRSDDRTSWGCFPWGCISSFCEHYFHCVCCSTTPQLSVTNSVSQGHLWPFPLFQVEQDSFRFSYGHISNTSEDRVVGRSWQILVRAYNTAPWPLEPRDIRGNFAGKCSSISGSKSAVVNVEYFEPGGPLHWINSSNMGAVFILAETTQNM